MTRPCSIQATGWLQRMTSAEIGRFEVENEDGEVSGPFEMDGASRLHTFAAEGRSERFTFRVLERRQYGGGGICCIW